MSRYRDGWKPKKNCKVCQTIRQDEKLYSRIMESSQYMKGGESLTSISEEYAAFFSYQSLFNHVKKHQALSGDQLVVRRVAQLQKKHDGEMYKKIVKAADAQQTLLEKLNDKLESGDFDDKMTVKDLIAITRDINNADAKKKDQAMDIMKMMAPHRSGEVIDMTESEFDPWKEKL